MAGRPAGRSGSSSTRSERVYLDSAPVIYAVERVPGRVEAVDARLAHPGTLLVASDLTRLECRVKPLRDGDHELLADFDAFFSDAISATVPITREVVDRATELRPGHGLKTPDALHMAAAMVSGCDVFLTNDRELRRVAGIRVEVVTA